MSHHGGERRNSGSPTTSATAVTACGSRTDRHGVQERTGIRGERPNWERRDTLRQDTTRRRIVARFPGNEPGANLVHRRRVRWVKIYREDPLKAIAEPSRIF